ncbi:MAG: flavin reductase [Sphaerochaetaceae bacterium]|nr:flavin reductase [Sphaerochaetaceae bacterium]
MDINVMNKLSYGLFMLSSKKDNKDNGCIVNTVMQVTASPNRIAVSVNKQNYTHDLIKDTGLFNVSILSEKSVFETYKHWGFQTGKEVDKTVDIIYSRSSNGLIYIAEGCNAYISAKVVESHDLGTHTLFIADVTDGEILNNEESVTYSFYHKKIKPAPQESKKKGWVCIICGYIYEGENLPADFICPLCKHPASDFKPL